MDNYQIKQIKINLIRFLFGLISKYKSKMSLVSQVFYHYLFYDYLDFDFQTLRSSLRFGLDIQASLFISARKKSEVKIGAVKQCLKIDLIH